MEMERRQLPMWGARESFLKEVKPLVGNFYTSVQNVQLVNPLVGNFDLSAQKVQLANKPIQVRKHPTVVLLAETGSGKTTQV